MQLQLLGAVFVTMLASDAPSRFSIVTAACLAACLALYADPPELTDDVPPARPPVTTHYVPLTGAVLDDWVSERTGDVDLDGHVIWPTAPGSCVPFLSPLLAHPHWQLRIANGASSCTGNVLLDSVAIDADGTVTWTRPGAPDRHLTLTADELHRIQTLDRFDCVRTTVGHYGEEWFRVALGGQIDGRDGAYLSRSSAIGEQLHSLLQTIIDRYAGQRLAALGPIAIDLRATAGGSWAESTIYTVKLRGTKLTVTRGHRPLHQSEIEPAELVDLVDTVIDGAPIDPGTATGRGTLRALGTTLPVSFTRWGPERAPFAVVARAIETAEWSEAQRQ